MSRVVIFLIPPKKTINGGILSIFSLCKESRRFKSVHKSEILICTYPGRESYETNDLFENDEKILSFDSAIAKYPKPESLIINIPEYAVVEVYRSLQKYKDYLLAIPDLHINILNQNIELMPATSEVLNLFNLASKVTQTTAHLSYTNQEVCDRYAVPTHLLSVSLDPSQYVKLKHEAKQNIIAYSPDKHPLKEKIIQVIKHGLPGYELVEINNMTYDNFKKLASNCKYMITFGEGFDGYMIETTFSGGVAFAVYNQEFFPSSDYKSLSNIYSSYEDMFAKIVDDITALEVSGDFDRLNEANYSKLIKIYNYDKYILNIGEFYKQNYSFQPNDTAVLKAFSYTLRAQDASIDQQQLHIEEQAAAINKQQLHIEEQAAELTSITNSRSWKVTKPLRQISKKSSKKG